MNFVVRDGLFSESDLRAAEQAWPRGDWSGWVHYGDNRGCKRASDLYYTPIPVQCSVLLAQMSALPVMEWFPQLTSIMVPDLGLYGSGLHEIPPGPGLPAHLDADTHQRLGLKRTLSASLYISENWLEEWGGELVICGERITPFPGRLVVFRSDQLHEVLPVSCPTGETRKSLALFWYSVQAGNRDRMQADFSVS